MCTCMCICVYYVCDVYMWQSQVENKHYSVAYFNRTRAFKALYLRTSVKGGAHTCYIEASQIDATVQHV